MADFRIIAAKYLRKERGFKYVSLLGKGSYGTVIKMENKERGSMAMKIVSKKLANSLEICHWKTLEHENVLKLIFVDQTLPTCVIFATELMKLSLTKRMQEQSFRQSKDALNINKKYIREVLLGLNYLHNRHVCHLDLRADNVFLAFDGRAVIADFSGLCHSNEKKNFCPLPRCFRPPEMLRTKKKVWPRPIDLWSLGLLTAHLFFLKKFYRITLLQGSVGTPETTNLYVESFQNPVKILTAVTKNFPSCKIPDGFANEFVSFISNFLQTKPRKRCHAQEALTHLFLMPNSDDSISNDYSSSVASCSSTAALSSLKTTIAVSTSTEFSSDASKGQKRLLSVRTVGNIESPSGSSNICQYCKSSEAFSLRNATVNAELQCVENNETERLPLNSMSEVSLVESAPLERSSYDCETQDTQSESVILVRSETASKESQELLMPEKVGDDSLDSEPIQESQRISNWKKIKNRLTKVGKVLRVSKGGNKH